MGQLRATRVRCVRHGAIAGVSLPMSESWQACFQVVMALLTLLTYYYQVRIIWFSSIYEILCLPNNLRHTWKYAVAPSLVTTNPTPTNPPVVEAVVVVVVVVAGMVAGIQICQC